MPFIPLYIRELGISNPDNLKLWVGVTAAAPGIAMAIASPFWGIASDRYGRKIMIVRAMVSQVFVAVGLGLVHSVQAVLLLRVLQGIFSGTVAAAATLVAAGTPRAHLTRALGFLSTATFMGHSIGPLIGGISADIFGFRSSFFIGAGIMAIGLILVVIFLEEPGEQMSVKIRLNRPPKKTKNMKISSMLSLPFLLLFSVMFLLRFATAQPRAFIPLYITELRMGNTGFLGVSDVAMTGIVMAGTALVGATAGFTLARLGDRFNKLWLITVSAALGSILALPTFFAPSIGIFALFYILSGYGLGGIQPFVQAYLSENSLRTQQGMLFGIQSLVGALGWGLGPMTASWISIQASTRHIFLSYTLVIGAIIVLMLFLRIFGSHFMNKIQKPPETRN